jgi:hypothetical protein
MIIIIIIVVVVVVLNDTTIYCKDVWNHITQRKESTSGFLKIEKSVKHPMSVEFFDLPIMIFIMIMIMIMIIVIIIIIIITTSSSSIRTHTKRTVKRTFIYTMYGFVFLQKVCPQIAIIVWQIAVKEARGIFAVIGVTINKTALK